MRVPGTAQKSLPSPLQRRGVICETWYIEPEPASEPHQTFHNQESRNSSIDVSELHKIRGSKNFIALHMYKMFGHVAVLVSK